jgi:hypothetical protein
VAIETVELGGRLVVTPALVTRWFGPEAPYRRAITGAVPAAALARFEAAVGALVGQEPLPWPMPVAFVTARLGA